MSEKPLELRLSDVAPLIGFANYATRTQNDNSMGVLLKGTGLLVYNSLLPIFLAYDISELIKYLQ